MVTTGMAGGRHATLHTQLRLCIHGEGISNQRIRNERRAQKAFGGLHNACTHGHAGWRAWTTIAFCNQSSLTKLVKMCALLLHPVATQGSCCMSCLHNPAWVARMCTNVTMGHATTARHLLQRRRLHHKLACRMLTLVAAGACLASVAALSGTPNGVPISTDCALRAEAWSFAQQALPRQGSFVELCVCPHDECAQAQWAC
jgi:hypothetical protein